MKRVLLVLLLFVFTASSACNKRTQNAEERQASRASGASGDQAGSNGGYLGGGEGGYLADNKSAGEGQASDDGEVATGDRQDDVGAQSPPDGDGCEPGTDCCENNEECVATQFTGCCGSDDAATECQWNVMLRDSLRREREMCTRVRCAAPPLSGCAEDNDGKEAQCVLGRCRLVPFR